MIVYLKLTLDHVDGPRRKADDVAAAAEAFAAGDTIELLTHEAFPVRSRYLIDDAQVVGREEVPA